MGNEHFHAESEVSAVVSAVVLLKVSPGHARKAAIAIRKIKGVREVNVVTGPYDIICKSEAGDMAALGDTVLTRIQRIPGVTDSLTCLVI
jgi:DNA-binding Lrp family transcriptional regulator